MPELVVFVGLQASGKSTAYKRWYSKTHVLVSKDKMSGKKEVKQTAQIRAALMAGKNVVVDNCNVTVEERARIIQIGREFNVRLICVEFHSILEECLERNAKRPGKACVPPVAIYIKAAKYVASSISEGFDKVILVRGVENETPAQEILR